MPGEWIEVAGLHERVERIIPVEVGSFAERYQDYLGVEQVAREYFVSTGTLNGWIRAGKVTPTVSFAFGAKTVHMFSREDVERFRVELDIPEHSDATIRKDFLDFLAERDYSLSYKMPFLLGFLARMDPTTGDARIDEVLDDYIAFYQDRVDRGLVVDRPTCPYDARTLADRKAIKSSMLRNPFEKFERKRFLYYSRDLGVISMNHALLAALTDEDYQAIQAQMQADLRDYYGKL